MLYDVLCALISIADIVTDVMVTYEFYIKDRQTFFDIAISIFVISHVRFYCFCNTCTHPHTQNMAQVCSQCNICIIFWLQREMGTDRGIHWPFFKFPNFTHYFCNCKYKKVWQFLNNFFFLSNFLLRNCVLHFSNAYHAIHTPQTQQKNKNKKQVYLDQTFQAFHNFLNEFIFFCLIIYFLLGLCVSGGK